MLLSLGHALIKIVQEFSKWDDEMPEHVIGLLDIDFMASLYHASVNFYHFFLDKSHVADCHVVQHMLSISIYRSIDLIRVIKIKFIHCFADKI